MSKHRRTRQQKIIANLRKKLSQQKTIFIDQPPKEKLPLENKPVEPIIKPTQQVDQSFYSYDPKLIKKSLWRTLILSLIFIATIFFSQKFFHL